jgi:hypothetical protein
MLLLFSPLVSLNTRVAQPEAVKGQGNDGEEIRE